MKPFSNLHLKLLALLSAIILWFIVITVENTVYQYPDLMNVEVTNLGANLSLANDVPAARLYLRVDKEVLKTLTENDFEVFIDLKNAEAGTRSVKIQATTTNPEVRILQVEPSEIELKLSPTSEKEVEVKVNVIGEASDGYMVEEVTAENEMVKITGAQSVIDTINHVNAELLLDGTEKANLKQTVMLAFDKEDKVPEGLVQVVPEQIVLSAVITSELKQKEVPLEPGFANENERTAWENNIRLNPETVLIQGGEEALAAVSELQTKPFEISTLNRVGSVEASIVLPEGVELVDPDQKIVLTLIESIPVEEPSEVPEETPGESPAEPDTIGPPSLEPTI